MKCRSGHRVIGPSGHRKIQPVQMTQSPDFLGEIEFRNLNFGYNGVSVLKDINLRIPAGSSLALVGPTGSGKTTLVNLIPRAYDAAPGRYSLTGARSASSLSTTYAATLALFRRKTFLFSDTIRANICVRHWGGRKARHPSPMWKRRPRRPTSRAKSKVSRKATTRWWASGASRSPEGRSSATAIARALLRSPQILILDDALSSVDTHTEDKILNHLRGNYARTHDDLHFASVSTVRNADRIAVLHQGCIVELGTHDELIARNGYYTELYNSNCWKKNWQRL